MDVTQEHNSDVFKSMRRQVEEYQPGLSKDATLAERVMYEANPDDLDFQRQFTADMPNSLAYYFATQYAKRFREEKNGRRAANTYLRERCADVLPRYRMVNAEYHIDHDPRNFDAFSVKIVDRLNDLHRMGKQAIKELALSMANHIIMIFREYCEIQENISPLEATKRIFKRIGAVVCQAGTVAPYWQQFTAGRKKPTENQMISGMLRMMSEKWWAGRLKRMRDIRAEHLAIAVGQVQNSASPYVSRRALKEWKEQKQRNREFIKNFDLQNDLGEKVSLESMVIGSVSNPAQRRRELMVRMRGFENLADEMGYVGEFYTLTAPSKYHNAYSAGGFVDQWNGSNPRDVQKYLCSVWAKVRAEYARKGIRPFGFRVVEPHHDSTPHWHLLLFIHPDQVSDMRKTFAEYAREEDAEELVSEKVKEARFKAIPIDKEKGSATGYIAKYISKNIDGFAMDDETDEESGKSCKEVAKNVSAWASRWRIRQFQQIGGAPVSVWRELRRLPGEEEILATEDMDNVRFAADIGDWFAYTELQGGATVARKDLTVRMSYEITEMGNEYGEDVQRISGVYSPIAGGESEYLTRTTKWQLVAKEKPAAAGGGLDFDPPWSSVNNCTEARRTINGKEKKIRSVMADLRSTGREISPEQAGKLISGSGIVIDGREITLLPDGQLRYRAGTTEKYERYREKSASILARVEKMRQKDNGN